MNILYKSAFRKFVKKQARGFQLAIEDETKRIKKEPRIGKKKKGDLSESRVYKFKFRGQEYLMAYKIESKGLIMYMIDTHENFYNNLKRYMKEVG